MAAKFPMGSGLPLRLEIPGAGEIQLFTINTTIVDRVRNAVAYGKVPESDLVRLRQQALDAAKGVRGPILRILATHHPVIYPDRPHPVPQVGMVLQNGREVARALAEQLDSHGHLAHLLLGGHAHQTYPMHDELPPSLRELHQERLEPDQGQLVTGSLLQVVPWIDGKPVIGVPPDTSDHIKRSLRPCQCEVLRFYSNSRQPGTIRMERLLATLPPPVEGMRWREQPGDYAFVRGRREGIAESMLLMIT